MQFQITLTDKLLNFKDYVEVKQIQDNGAVIGEYRMALNDIIRALTDAATEGVKQETPFLPNNCIKLVSDAIGHQVFIELKKRQWPVEFNNEKFMLGFPRLVFKYYVSNKAIHHVKIFAIKEYGAINEHTEMYYFPYSNVHHESGEVCMGMNLFPKIECLTQLETMHLLFFTAPFGNDYGSRAIGQDLEGLLKAFREKDFDDDVLMPMNKTFNEVFLL